ncbi:helix-turn-helix domain-containing protein [Tissierella pigra]|uniref:Helix-turn-helix domain-containing protein n=1 Tax=Tissierella pigra TaxID=2607614 RepID=A0A6N7Y066_9FIRM|nr:helix-turn-helix domain-containing protein [Tissierella pigra]MSU02115.1 helix-turn-helix domain-containing protein [Tissierella pigra]
MQGITITNEERLKAIKLIEEGKSMEEIISEVGLSKPSIYKIINLKENNRIDAMGNITGKRARFIKGYPTIIINPIICLINPIISLE